MKRKILTLMVIIGGFALTSCQDDPTMDELIQDIELKNEATEHVVTTGSGGGGDGDGNGGQVPPPDGN